jgi:hypothetical protein
VSCGRDGQIRLAELSSMGVCNSTRRLAQHRGPAHKLAIQQETPHVFLSSGEDALVMSVDVRETKPEKYLIMLFILGFCIVLRVLYQGYRKIRPSQQPFKAFIYIYFAATCFRPRWPSSGGIHNISGKLPHYNGSTVLCYRSYFVYGLANTAVVYLICGNVKTLKC